MAREDGEARESHAVAKAAAVAVANSVGSFRHVQWEPLWGGRVDAAAELRGTAARTVDPSPRRIGLRASALLRQEESLAFLLEQVRKGSSRDAVEAIESLDHLRGDERLAARVREPATGRVEPEVARALLRVLG